MTQEWMPEKGEMIECGSDTIGWNPFEYVTSDERAALPHIVFDTKNHRLLCFGNIRPIKKEEPKFKLYDVYETANNDRLILLSTEVDEDGDFKFFHEPSGSLIWHEPEEVTPRPDLVAVAPAIAILPSFLSGENKSLEITGLLYLSEKDARHDQERYFIRWPATPTSFVIVERERLK